MAQPLWKTIWQLLKKLNVNLPYDLAIPFLVISPRKMKAYVHTKTSIWIFTANLFVIAENWKQLKYPVTGEYSIKWILLSKRME